MTLGESFSSLGFSFHCKISILEFSGTQRCRCFSDPESLLKGNNSIKAYFTYHKIYPFQVYNSMIFSKFTNLCNHHHKSVLEHFYHSNKSFVCVCVCVLSCIRLFVTYQASPSVEFSRQGYWSELPFPPPGYLPNPGTESTSAAAPALAGSFFTTVLPAQVNPHSHPLPQATSSIYTF